MIEMPTDANPVTVVEGDCLDVLGEMPAHVGFPAVITDPPYGIALASNGTWFRSMRAIAGDETQECGQLALDICRGRGWPVCAFADPLKPWRGDWRQALAWDKGGAVGIGGDRATCWKRSWELIQVSRLFGALGGSRDEAVLSFPMMPSDSAEHPAAKSLDLMRYLVAKLTRPGDIILDPFAGSGTTAVAALHEGRKCIAIEKDPAYCAIIRRRVKEATDDGLFAGVKSEQLTILDGEGD